MEGLRGLADVLEGRVQETALRRVGGEVARGPPDAPGDSGEVREGGHPAYCEPATAAPHAGSDHPGDDEADGEKLAFALGHERGRQGQTVDREQPALVADDPR